MEIIGEILYKAYRIYLGLILWICKVPLYGVLNEDTYTCILINGVRLNSGQNRNS